MSKRQTDQAILLTNQSAITKVQSTGFLITTELNSHVSCEFQLFDTAPQVGSLYTGIYLISFCSFQNHCKGVAFHESCVMSNILTGCVKSLKGDPYGSVLPCLR